MYICTIYDYYAINGSQDKSLTLSDLPNDDAQNPNIEQTSTTRSRDSPPLTGSFSIRNSQRVYNLRLKLNLPIRMSNLILTCLDGNRLAQKIVPRWMLLIFMVNNNLFQNFNLFIQVIFFFCSICSFQAESEQSTTSTLSARKNTDLPLG